MVTVVLQEDMGMQAVKSTINISAQLKNELIGYVEKGAVASLSSGVNAAIELYLKELKRAEYDGLMAEAARDREFLERTLGCQKEFDKHDDGVAGEW